MVTRRVSAAEAKAHLSALVSEVAHAQHYIIIERHGEPVAALVGMDDLARLEEGSADTPHGALALVGAWRDIDDEDVDAVVADIYRARLDEVARPVDPLE